LRNLSKIFSNHWFKRIV